MKGGGNGDIYNTVNNENKVKKIKDGMQGIYFLIPRKLARKGMALGS